MNLKKFQLLIILFLVSFTLVVYGKDASTPEAIATDYSKSEHWLSLPAAVDKEVDVFYLYSTAWQKVNENEPNICEIDNPSMLIGAPAAFARQATVFTPIGNIYAPFYRQADLSPVDREKVIGGIPTLDAVAAFDYYIKYYNNGRPFILAGHSQGSNVLSNLLAGYMKDHPEVLKNMVAAYVIGFPVTAAYLAQNPHLKFAEGPDDTGVIISYNTEAPDVAPGSNPVLSGMVGLVINPITWTREETLATASEGLGSFLPDPVTKAFSRVPQYADARIDKTNGVLICSTADEDALYKLSGALGKGVYHSFDYLFYYYNIQANAKNRVNKYLDSSGINTTTTTTNNFPVVVFSDVHFNPFDDPSLFPALVSADSSQWAGIFKTSSLIAPSAWGSDTNYPLLVLALSSIKQNLGVSPLIIYTGDILGHNFPQTFFKLYGSQNPPSAADVAAMKAFTDKTVAFFMQQVRSSVGNIPVMFAVGNSDSYTGLGPDSSFLSDTAELYYTDFLNGTGDHQAFLNTFTSGGYYSAEPTGTNLMVIGLNTFEFSPFFGDTTTSAVTAELAWFDSTLASAQARGKKVWLLMHVPPGADKYSTAQSVDSNGHITSATMMWNQDYQTSFLQILSKYPGVITLTLAAHTHMDEYRILSSSNVLEITPSIAPYFGNNPAFKVFTFSQDTFKPTDYSSLNYDLATNPGQFNSYYTFSTAYSVRGLLNHSLAQLFPVLVTNSAKQALYRGRYFSGHNYSIPVTNTFNPITDKNWPVYWCGIGRMEQQELIDGVNSYAPLGADNVNLIFVVSPDLAYHAPGDINPNTANLTNQGLQRSLLMATYLKQQVLGTKNVNRIYTLAPMTHLQTTNNYPDMSAIGYIQQFALLNQITLTGKGGYGSPLYTANSYPLNAAYGSGPLPSGVATPLVPSLGCQGLDFNDTGSNNETLVTGIVKINVPGFYVFSAPWETISALMANINTQQGYNLTLSTSYMGPNYVYAISIAPSGSASLVTYHSNLNPPSTYPVLPLPVDCISCPGPDTTPVLFDITVTGGINGAVIPEGINTNQTIYLIRHAEAHPWSGWDDGNFVGAGQWRALALPNALRGKIDPAQVYSIEPAQVYPGAYVTAGNSNFSYVRPSLTVEPYAIANNLPYYLVSDFEIFANDSPQLTSNFFFFNPKFSNQTVLLAWEHKHFPPTINALLSSYFPQGGGPTAPAWPDDDYDTIWTVTLDAQGNLTVNNALCEGIDSAKLPVTAPQF